MLHNISKGAIRDRFNLSAEELDLYFTVEFSIGLGKSESAKHLLDNDYD